STRLNSSHVEISYAVFCLTKVQTCALDRKSTRLNSSHGEISYAVFCLKEQQTAGLAGWALDRSDLGALGATAARVGARRHRAPGAGGHSRRQRNFLFRPFFSRAGGPPEANPLPRPGPLGR